MNKIPIVFAFDTNLAMPAAVCIHSLLTNARIDTRYCIYILHRKGTDLDISYIDKVMATHPDHELKMIEVDGTFDNSFKIRGITTPAYYRLLIPSLIPEHDKVIYSDVDVIFRQDLSEVYSVDLDGNILAGVNNLAHIDLDLRQHYGEELLLDTNNVICSGFLVMDTAAMRKEKLEEKFKSLARNRYKFQDQDVLNIACARRIKMLKPKYSLLTYVTIYAMQDKHQFYPLWTSNDIDEALTCGNIHYNGQKPWQGWCLNFDIWWEYYRKSPIFDEEFYFKFFNSRMDEYDRLTFIKRAKILARYFFVGRKK